MYLYDRGSKMVTLKNFKMECKADIYTINKNNKNNNKNQYKITKVSEKFPLWAQQFYLLYN